jgi:hypothetical protein
MRTDAIKAVGIDEQGSLWVKPATAAFPYVYREAMEVHWDAEKSRLFGAKPRTFPDLDFSRPRWFRQIVAAAEEHGVELILVETTEWSNIDSDLRAQIEAAATEMP